MHNLSYRFAMWFSGILVKFAKYVKRDQDVQEKWTGKPEGFPQNSMDTISMPPFHPNCRSSIVPIVAYVDFVRVVVHFEDSDPIKWYVPSNIGLVEHIPTKGAIWGDSIVDYTNISFGKVTLSRNQTVEMALKEVAKIEAGKTLNT